MAGLGTQGGGVGGGGTAQFASRLNPGLARGCGCNQRGGAGGAGGFYDGLAGFLRLGQRGLGTGHGGFGVIAGGKAGGKCCGCDQSCRDSLLIGCDARKLFSKTACADFGLAERLRQHTMAGCNVGCVFGGAVGLGIGGGGGLGGFDDCGFSRIKPGGVRCLFGVKAGIFFGKPGTGAIGFAQNLLGMGEIGTQLAQPRLDRVQCGTGAGFLGGQSLASNAVAFQRRAGLAFAFAQCGQGGCGLGGLGGGFGRTDGEIADRGLCGMQRGGGGGAQCLGPRPLQRHQFSLRRPHQPRDRPVAIGLARLPLEAFQLHVQLAAQIVGAFEIGLGGA